MAFRFFLLFLCMVAGLGIRGGKAQPSNFLSVMEFGAVGDGKTYDTLAFINAWRAICSGERAASTLIIPTGKTFLLQALKFQGPCNFPSLTIQILGKIIAPTKENWPKDDLRYWIDFSNVNNLIIDGTTIGQLDGQGSGWWNCSQGKPCDNRHASLAFNGCNNIQVTGLKSINSQNNHISINGCKGAIISDVQLLAPTNSPNTDGIDISQSSTNIQIHDSTMATGDDCVAITNGCSFINITNINCGPGHGVSIGSLGKDGGEGMVEEVHVKHCTFNGTQNGARIKTWPGGRGFVRKVTYEDITLIGADNPIVIDQFYCPDGSCHEEPTAVAISDVSFSRIRGTTVAEYAIRFNCSQNFPCSRIILDHINITATNPSSNLDTYCKCASEGSNDVSPMVHCICPNSISMVSRGENNEDSLPSTISMVVGGDNEDPSTTSSISMVVEDEDGEGHDELWGT